MKIGLFSIKVIKLAWLGNISNLPLELVEESDKPSPSNTICLGEIILMCKVGIKIT